MGCGSSVELFDKSVYTSLPGTPQPERRTDRNKNAIEDDKTLRGDVIQKQYARKTREEKLKMMDRRRSSAAKEISDRAMEDRERLSLSSRYGSRATSRTTSRTGSPSMRVTPLAMANGIMTPQRDEVRSAGRTKKLSDLNEATSDSIELRGGSKQADLKGGTEEVTTGERTPDSLSERDDKENRLDGRGVGVESAGARKGKGKKWSGKKGNRGSVDDGENVKQEERKTGETGEERTVGRIAAGSGDGSDDNAIVNHPHVVDADTDRACESFRGSNVVTVTNQDGDSLEEGKLDGATKQEETNNFDNNDKIDEKSVQNKRKSERKKRKARNVDGECKNLDSVMKGTYDQKQADDVVTAGNPELTSNVDEQRAKSFIKPEIRVSDGEIFNFNNNATDLSTGDLGSDLDIKAGSDLDLMAPSLPSFSAKASGAKKGKPLKKKRSSKREKRSGERVGELGVRDR
ncbi:uncharacterized protein LOC135501563 [Lineus longissimus]|uniref:uncharacterized protein LOC135501563 n=1 Tax=Lineus longissimus TaxID=88925 RepID=UPI002B4DE7A8